jgi:hypothetical protein
MTHMCPITPGGVIDAPLVLVAPPSAAVASPNRQIRAVSKLDETALIFEGEVGEEDAGRQLKGWMSSDSNDEAEGRKGGPSASKNNGGDVGTPAAPGASTEGQRGSDYSAQVAAVAQGTAEKTRHLTDLGRFLKGRLAALLRWVWFDRIMLFMIFASCIFLALDSPDLDPDSQLGRAEVRAMFHTPQRSHSHSLLTPVCSMLL